MSNSFEVLNWSAISGQTYRVQTKLDLEAIKVFTLPCDLAALLLERRSQREVQHPAF